MLSDDRGQGLAEYGLVLGLIAVVCIVLIITLGSNIRSLLTRAGTSI